MLADAHSMRALARGVRARREVVEQQAAQERAGTLDEALVLVQRRLLLVLGPGVDGGGEAADSVGAARERMRGRARGAAEGTRVQPPPAALPCPASAPIHPAASSSLIPSRRLPELENESDGARSPLGGASLASDLQSDTAMDTQTVAREHEGTLTTAFFLVVPAMLTLTYWIATFAG